MKAAAANSPAWSASGTAGQSCGDDEVRWRWSGFLPRSFLFSVTPVLNRPAGMVEIPTPEGQLFVSPDYQCFVGTSDSGFVVLIGHCMDLRQRPARELQIATRLADLAVRDGFEPMLADTDDLAGRYAAICRSGDGWRVFNDAFATRAVYFAEDRPAIASHSTILGDLSGRSPRMDLFRHYWCALPGTASPVAGVRVLPANFALDIQSRCLRRFWPRTERRERPVSKLIDKAETIFVETAEAIAARWNPAISLTAGLDSRLTLSICRHIPNIVAFTYDRHEQDRTDADVAQQVCSRLGIEHRRLGRVDRSRAESVYGVMDRIVDCPVEKGLPAIYLSAFPGDTHLHVRSNLAEIGRAFWRRHPGMPTTIAPSNWVDVSMARSTRNLPMRREAAAYMLEEMDRFFSIAGYNLPNSPSATIRGYEVWDLAYMEHRMSTWLGPALLGSDMAFDTTMLFDSRRIADLLLSAPLEDRKNETLFRQIIAARCPEIADIPINPRPRRAIPGYLAGAYRQIRRRAKWPSSSGRSSNA
jgi:hypothetical protein